MLFCPIDDCDDGINWRFLLKLLNERTGPEKLTKRKIFFQNIIDLFAFEDELEDDEATFLNRILFFVLLLQRILDFLLLLLQKMTK